MISVSRSTRLSPLSPRDAGRPRLFWFWGIYLHLCCHVHFIDARCLCTLSVHVVCALHLCTSSVHFICALHLCTLSVHSGCFHTGGFHRAPLDANCLYFGLGRLSDAKIDEYVRRLYGLTSNKPSKPTSCNTSPASLQAQQACKPRAH